MAVVRLEWLDPRTGFLPDLVQESYHVLHRGPILRPVARAEHGDPECLQHLLYLRVGMTLEVRIKDVDRVLLALQASSNPLDNVLPVGECRVDRSLAGNDFQQNDSVAINIAPLRDLRHTCVLCDFKGNLKLVRKSSATD